MPDFSPAGARQWPGPTDGSGATSTDLARSYGLEGEWQVSRSEFLPNAAISRLAGPLAPDLRERPSIPAVAGKTIESPMDTVVACPNWAGVVELDRSGVVLDPLIAGAVTLPDCVRGLRILLADEALTLVPGSDDSLTGLSAALAHAEGERSAWAEAARRKARLLAKRCEQLPGVRTRQPTETGRFILETPVDADALITATTERGVTIGVPTGLPEYPGGIVVTVGPVHTTADIDQASGAVAEALGAMRTI